MADHTTISLFNAAIDKIEEVARVAQKEGDDLASAFVYSGGVFAGDAPQKQISAIYLAPMAAIADWRDQVIKLLECERAATFRFSEIPKLEKLIMTETDEMGCQRLTATRYGVTSKVAVLSRLAPATLAAVPSRKPKPKLPRRRPRPSRHGEGSGKITQTTQWNPDCLIKGFILKLCLDDNPEEVMRDFFSNVDRKVIAKNLSEQILYRIPR